MAVTSNRSIAVSFDTDIQFAQFFSAAESAVASGKIDVVSLAIGANTITAPVITGVVNKGLTIVPPAGNTSLMTLKGIAGDTGIALHLTDPTSISLDTTFVSLVINAAAEIVGVRLIWS